MDFLDHGLKILFEQIKNLIEMLDRDINFVSYYKR